MIFRSRYYALCCVVSLILSACQIQPTQVVAVQQGQSRTQVKALLGEPMRTQSFLLPEAPFFGPQESLTGLVPAGTPIEEWTYLQGEEELYIWFICDHDQPDGECSMIESARYPIGAVY